MIVSEVNLPSPTHINSSIIGYVSQKSINMETVSALFKDLILRHMIQY